MNCKLSKAFRWIAVPFMFPIGMLLGHWFGMLNALFPYSYIGLFFFWIICGACTSFGCILLPACVAPNHKIKVAKIALILQAIFIVASMVIAFASRIYEGKELAEYIISMVGTIVGVIWCQFNIQEIFEQNS